MQAQAHLMAGGRGLRVAADGAPSVDGVAAGPVRQVRADLAPVRARIAGLHQELRALVENLRIER